MNSYKDLDIYKIAYRLAVDVHQMTLSYQNMSFMNKVVKSEDHQKA